jgi:hypothetical protein
MILFENLAIAVEKEGDIFRAYAFNAVTEENIASCKCEREGGAIAGLFNDLRNVAINKAESK